MPASTKQRLAELCKTVAGLMLDRGHSLAKWQPDGDDRAKIRCSRLGCDMEARVDAETGETEGKAHQKDCTG